MLSLDEFRWVLTGGTRLIDTASLTVLERTYQSGQDGGGDAPNKTVSSAADLAGATPFNWSSASTRIWGMGSAMAITGSGNLNGATVPYTGQGSLTSPAAGSSSVYLLYLNVQVCNPTVSLEANCVAYGSNYKPEGLMQKYSSQLRYSAFGYLNDSNTLRDGGVMRAALKFIGPTQPVPGFGQRRQLARRVGRQHRHHGDESESGRCHRDDECLRHRRELHPDHAKRRDELSERIRLQLEILQGA